MSGQIMLTIDGTNTVVIPERIITDEDGHTRPVCEICRREATFSGEMIRVTCVSFNDEGIPVVRFEHETCAK